LGLRQNRHPQRIAGRRHAIGHQRLQCHDLAIEGGEPRLDPGRALSLGLELCVKNLRRAKQQRGAGQIE
jgi:hypothetical protein